MRRDASNALFCLLVAAGGIGAAGGADAAFALSPPPVTKTCRRRRHVRRVKEHSSLMTRFFANQQDDNEQAPSATTKEQQQQQQQKDRLLGRKEGVYTRPSAAIERGSGFFIPGLEGPKIRVAVGIVLLAATAANHVVATTTDGGGQQLQRQTAANGDALAEVLAVVYGVLVLLQAGVEAVQEMQNQIVIQVGSSSSSSSSKSSSSTSSKSSPSQASSSTLAEAWSEASWKDPNWRERVAWSARSLLALTAATQVLLVGPTGIVYRLGRESNSSSFSSSGITSTERTNQNEEDARAVQALKDTLQQSPSGRVALPVTHPTARIWAPDQDCVVVQRIRMSPSFDKADDGDDAGGDEENTWAWIVTSPETLAATLTQKDLQWLGPLAENVVLSVPEA